MIRLLLVLLLLPITAHSARLHPERYYQDNWCDGKGIVEYRLPDATRVDCLTSSHAIEFDFADKWAESIGQALHYSAMTGKRAGVVLIVEDAAKQMKYVDRVKSIIREFHLPIDLRIVGQVPTNHF